MACHDGMRRREFVGGAFGGSLLAAQKKTSEVPSRRSILNFNEQMDYRKLGKTGLLVSSVCMGGHWKRVSNGLKEPFDNNSFSGPDYKSIENPEFLKNRHDVVSRAIDMGINYVDACTGQEVLVYSKVLKGRRQKMYLGFSWIGREPRKPEWRTGKKLLEGLDQSFKEAGLDYVDVWRITLPMRYPEDLSEIARIEEATAEALSQAKRQGKARFTGVSTHNRVWVKSLIEQYPKEMEVVLFPYTANTKELPTESVFRTLEKYETGVFGIKPFADNRLFAGTGAVNDPHREEDDRRARLAIRYILENPAISAPIAGLANLHQVDNAAKAVAERRKLDARERADLERASRQMWARLDPGYQWLKDWEYV